MTALDMAAYHAMTPEEKIVTLTHWHEVAATSIERLHADNERLRAAMENAAKILRQRSDEWADALACVLDAERSAR